MENIRQTDELALELSRAIIQSEEYKEYRACLELIKQDEYLYNQVNELRRRHFTAQNGEGDRMSYEDYSSLSNQAAKLRENEIVSRFLDSETGLGRLIQDVNRNVMSCIEFDTDFLY